MTEYDEEWVFPICVVFASVIVSGIMFIGAGTLDYTLKTNNYQTALKMTTECRVQTKLNPDEICGKIPTWEQYK
jgi:hypothetical protein